MIRQELREANKRECMIRFILHRKMRSEHEEILRDVIRQELREANGRECMIRFNLHRKMKSEREEILRDMYK